MQECIKEIRTKTTSSTAVRINVSNILHAHKVHLNTSAVLQDMGHLAKIKNGVYKWKTTINIDGFFARKVLEESEKRAAGYQNSNKKTAPSTQMEMPELTIDAIIERNEQLKKRKQQLLESINIENLKRENEILELEIKKLENISNQ